MTKQQHDILSEFEESFREAKSGYYRALIMSDAQKINQIWAELGHEKVQLTCGKCVLTLLQKIGAEYFSYVEPKPTEEKEIKTNKKTKKIKK